MLTRPILLRISIVRSPYHLFSSKYRRKPNSMNQSSSNVYDRLIVILYTVVTEHTYTVTYVHQAVPRHPYAFCHCWPAQSSCGYLSSEAHINYFLQNIVASQIAWIKQQRCVRSSNSYSIHTVLYARLLLNTRIRSLMFTKPSQDIL